MVIFFGSFLTSNSPMVPGGSGLQQNGSTCQCWWLCGIGGAKFFQSLGSPQLSHMGDIEIAFFDVRNPLYCKMRFQIPTWNGPNANRLVLSVCHFWFLTPLLQLSLGHWWVTYLSESGLRVDCFRSPGRKWWTTCFVTFTTSASASQPLAYFREWLKLDPGEVLVGADCMGAKL